MASLDPVERYVRGWVAHDADAVLATLNADGTYEDPSTGGPVSGQAFKAYMQGLWSAFPDLTFEKQSLGAMAADLIAAQWVMTGTNSGSMMGLPPTGRRVELRGADFFRMKNGKIQTVTGYFDAREVPRQLGLNIIVQPHEVGPFKFGVSTSVQTGKLQEPGAFSITMLEARDAGAVARIREGSRASLIDMLKMDGFIGATTAVIGTRMVTISAWDKPESSRRVMKEGAHAEAQKGFYDGSLPRLGYTSVWTKHRINPYWVRCEACGTMRGRKEGETAMTCSCGAPLPPPSPYW
jgi:steroid delta-isomerase-like uncharacterized protein